MNNYLPDNDHKISWRFFIWFLLLILIVGLATLYYLLPSLFKGKKAQQIPIVPEKNNDFNTRVEAPVLNQDNIGEAARFISS